MPTSEPDDQEELDEAYENLREAASQMGEAAEEELEKITAPDVEVGRSRSYEDFVREIPHMVQEILSLLDKGDASRALSLVDRINRASFSSGIEPWFSDAMVDALENLVDAGALLEELFSG